MTYFYIALGGIFGAIARYQTSIWLSAYWVGNFPVGTWVANVIGCFLIGLLLPQGVQTNLSPNIRFLWVTGFMGAYTTFSTFSLESLSLIQKGDAAMAAFYIAASLIGGLGATAAGMALSKWF